MNVSSIDLPRLAPRFVELGACQCVEFRVVENMVRARCGSRVRWQRRALRAVRNLWHAAIIGSRSRRVAGSTGLSDVASRHDRLRGKFAEGVGAGGGGRVTGADVLAGAANRGARAIERGGNACRHRKIPNLRTTIASTVIRVI